MSVYCCLHTIAQVRIAERAAYEKEKLTEQVLMQRAGEAALRVLLEHWPKAQSICIVCGSGCNAGDGYVLARLAKGRGLDVTILHFSPLNELTGLVYQMAYQCQKDGITCQPFTNALLEQADLIIDAILGIGLHGEIGGDYLKAMIAINHIATPVLSIDVPSGLDADTGQALGISIYADKTVTFMLLKQGLFTALGPVCCGEVILDTLGLTEQFYRNLNLKSVAICLGDSLIHKHLPARPRNVHKGYCGHVLLIGGNYGMGGAICMAAAAAARVGAGLVSVATRPEHINIVMGVRPELMCHGVEKAGDIDQLLEKASIVAIGPGLGEDTWAQNLLDYVLKLKKVMVIDADALNLLAKQEQLHYKHWLLTPHPGEAARMLDCSVSEIQIDRFHSVSTIQKRYGGVCVLKGAGTLVKGFSDSLYLCTGGNPGMASGGMGDILTGTLAGLVAQGLTLLQAAKVGVLLHSKAADLAALEGGERGLLATDLLPYLRRIVNIDP